jgi:hypothetical protein
MIRPVQLALYPFAALPEKLRAAVTEDTFVQNGITSDSADAGTLTPGTAAKIRTTVKQYAAIRLHFMVSHYLSSK